MGARLGEYEIGWEVHQLLTPPLCPTLDPRPTLAPCELRVWPYRPSLSALLLQIQHDCEGPRRCWRLMSRDLSSILPVVWRVTETHRGQGCLFKGASACAAQIQWQSALKPSKESPESLQQCFSLVCLVFLSFFFFAPKNPYLSSPLRGMSPLLRTHSLEEKERVAPPNSNQTFGFLWFMALSLSLDLFKLAAASGPLHLSADPPCGALLLFLCTCFMSFFRPQLFDHPIQTWSSTQSIFYPFPCLFSQFSH